MVFLYFIRAVGFVETENGVDVQRLTRLFQRTVVRGIYVKSMSSGLKIFVLVHECGQQVQKVLFKAIEKRRINHHAFVVSFITLTPTTIR